MTNASCSAPTNVSPAASGPAGPQFEGQVGAHYLLSLLAGSEPRGLPGTTVNRVAFQGASDGYALDDVIVHSIDHRGAPAVLEIQVKRTIDFTPSDTVFRDVVAQVAQSASKPEFDTQRYELAVALERTSTKIERVYQEVLQWARHCSSAQTFSAHISRAGMANDAMRQFVETFRTNLKLAAASHDDAALWQILRRFQILVFDFNQHGSASELLARERCAMLLAPQDSLRGGELWTTLSSLAIERAATAGDHDTTSLRDVLAARFTYRWAGDRRLAGARAALDELSAGVLKDIVTDVAGIRIDRAALVMQVDAALESARYVEIRGDAGDGKSGVLKHLAERIGREARVVALSADRTPAGGWTPLRSILGCEASAREFLADIACDGAAVLFIDGVDFFDDEGKRATVRDLIRAAADVPQFSVVVTARRNFGIDEPSWLPAEELARLVPSTPIVIKELAASEIDQLKDANTSLAALMADNHPARAVVRNLFRLARLVRQASVAPAPLTEAEMAWQWWTSADGHSSGRRERLRLLKSMALHAMTQNGPMDASAAPPAAIQALVHSGSLRELQSDLVGFQHDVLREWAIACVLFEEPARIANLPLSGPAPAGLVRAMELTARLCAERGSDHAGWTALVQMLTGPSIHGSWRRSALLALVRSELGESLLERISAGLLANDGVLLADLVRTTVAIDSEPAARIWSMAGIDPAMLPVGLITPTAPSWIRLIIWSLGAKARLPSAVIPVFVDLYNKWTLALFGQDPLTPLIIEQLHAWLVEIEKAFHPEASSNRRQAFGISQFSENARNLESDLRMGFLAFCQTMPKLAESYLRAVIARRAGDHIALDALKFSGSLAQAAPAALADLALRTFIPEPDDELDDRRDRHGPFGFVDLDYMPASPAQGPFLDLLQRAPIEGIRLVREVVNYAIQYKTGGRDGGGSVITIPFPDGNRDFPWPRSYMWSRDNQDSYLVSSALMALEFWSHERIEAGQPFDKVLADVIAPSGSPAAFLLVAVDLLLTHWPQSQESAWPFLASPELLTLDRDRFAQEYLDHGAILDAVGFGSVNESRKPPGLEKFKSLRSRPSRRASLDDLIGNYAVNGPQPLLATLQKELSRAVRRLGPVEEGYSGFRDPRFTAAHALNLSNADNWPEVTWRQADGSEITARRYRSPAEELALVAPGQAESSAGLEDMQLRLNLATALSDRKKSSAELVEKGIAWARTESSHIAEAGDTEWRTRSRVIAATLAMRDGSDPVRASHADWARGIFAEALSAPDDTIHRHREGLAYNPVAIATVGLISVLRHRPAPGDTRELLRIAARYEASMAHAFEAEAAKISEIDPRLPIAILRVALSGQVRTRSTYHDTAEMKSAIIEANRRRTESAVEHEIAWLDGGGTEPSWPVFPAYQSRGSRPKLRLPGGKGSAFRAETPKAASSDESVDHQGAALWLRKAIPFVNPTSVHWLRLLVESYSTWTASANGVDQAEEVESGRTPMEWNLAYFELVARTLVGMSVGEIDRYACNLICKLPDEPFFDAMAFLRVIDSLHFNDQGVDVNTILHIRRTLAKRLMASRGWRYLTQQNSSSIEVHIAPAIAVLFMHDYPRISPAKCYLYPKGAARLDMFMPLIGELTTKAASSAFVATLCLGLIEVSVQPKHLGYAVASARAWQAKYRTDIAFWVDLGIGRRICNWLEEVIRISPTTFLAADAPVKELDKLLDHLVRHGVASAHKVEQALEQLRQ